LGDFKAVNASKIRVVALTDRTAAYLELFSAWVGTRRVQQIADELEAFHRGTFRLPDKVLIALFTARSGSNFLGQLLSSTGWFREIGESCRPSQLIKVRDRKGLADTHSAAQWMIDNRGTPAAFGMKAGALVLIAAAHLGLLSEIEERVQFVHLRRRDRVAQAISMHKLRLGGRGHTQQSEERVFSDGDYDAEAIAAEIARIDVAETQFISFLEFTGKSATSLFYEDICADPETHVARICDRMNLQMPRHFEPNVRVGIMRDTVSRGWHDRFLEDCPECR